MENCQVATSSEQVMKNCQIVKDGGEPSVGIKLIDNYSEVSATTAQS